MGTKYTSQSSSGYNTGNPPDNGSTGTDNKVNWAVIRTALTDVLKTFTEAVNSALVAYFDFGGKTQGAPYTTVADDNGRTIEVTGTTLITLGAAATMTSGYVVTIKNVSGTTTVKPGGVDEIDGSTATRTLAPGSAETYRVNQAATDWLLDSIPLLDEDDMASDDSSAAPSQQSVKAYVDSTNWTYHATFNTTGLTLGSNTSIPTTTIGIKFVVDGLSGSAGGAFYIELGDSGGYSTTIAGSSQAYNSTLTAMASGLYNFVAGSSNTNLYQGQVEFTKLNGSFKWTGSGSVLPNATTNGHASGGTITLAGALDRCRVTAENDGYDAGQVQVFIRS